MSDDLLVVIEESVEVLVAEGLVGGGAALGARWRGLAERAERVGWVWVAELLRGLARDEGLYRGREIGFEGREMGVRVGELLLRLDGLRGGMGTNVGGMERGRPWRVGERLVGLGTEVVVGEGVVSFRVYWGVGGEVVVRGWERPLLASDDGLSWRALASGLVGRWPLAWLGERRLLLPGARRTGYGELLGVEKGVLMGGGGWDELEEPVRMESVGRLLAVAGERGPRCFGPRRWGEHMVVLPVAEVREIRFERREQMLVLVVADGAGGGFQVWQRHMGRNGLARCFEWWRSGGVVWVAGHWSWVDGGVVVRPTALVVDGVVVQTWLVAEGGDGGEVNEMGGGVGFLSELEILWGELLVVGWRGLSGEQLGRWRRWLERGEGLDLSERWFEVWQRLVAGDGSGLMVGGRMVGWGREELGWGRY
ncbi:MAG TPA: hypothetical protein VLL52_22915 [Anaerolineae bacterium]|nr:hypothetical protein [Anaerolineae bacterium]